MTSSERRAAGSTTWRRLPRIEARLAKLNPAPTRKIPVLIGGGSEKKSLWMAAKHADIWHGFGDPEVIERKVGILRGRRPRPGGDRDFDGVKGDPEDVGPKLRALGGSLFTVGPGGPDYDLSELRDWIAWRDTQNA